MDILKEISDQRGQSFSITPIHLTSLMVDYLEYCQSPNIDSEVSRNKLQKIVGLCRKLSYSDQDEYYFMWQQYMLATK